MLHSGRCSNEECICLKKFWKLLMFWTTNLEQGCNLNWGSLISNLRVSNAGILGFLICLRTVVSDWGIQSTFICFLLGKRTAFGRDSSFSCILNKIHTRGLHLFQYHAFEKDFRIGLYLVYKIVLNFKMQSCKNYQKYFVLPY